MNNNQKLYLLGIDGLSFDFIKDHLEQLPTFKESFDNGDAKVLKSNFPPDSIPAWITIFTGESPAEHGVLDSIDYLDDKNLDQAPKVNAFKGKTFWDVLSSKRKRVCVINPFLAFPVWNVNGYFVNASVFATEKKYGSNNKELFNKFKVPLLGGLTSFPPKSELDNFIKDAVKETKDLAEYSTLLHTDDEYDLFFITYFTMDRYQHFLWRYTDESDITYPGENKYKNIILDFYERFDSIVAEVKAALKENEGLVIISDHGHGQRCVRALNINEILRKKGLYFVKTNKIKILDKKYLIERIKNVVMDLVFKYNLEDIFYKLVKFIPNRKGIKKGDHLKTTANIAEACTMFGTNPFGGIRIYKENIPKRSDYDTISKDLINYFSDYSYNGKKVIKWIKKREDVFQGKHINKFADLLFEMDPEFGVNWSVFTKEVTYNTTHKKISGGHDRNGCFITYNLDKFFQDKVNSVGDIYKFVTEYFS